MRRITAAALLGWVVGCSAEVSAPVGYEGDSTQVPGTGGPGGPGTGGGNGGGTGGGGSGGNGNTVEPPARPDASPRFIRLSHDQWAATVEDALGFEGASDVASEFRADSFGAAFIFDNPADLSVDESLWLAYQRGAARVADAIVNDNALYRDLIDGLTEDENGARTLAQRLALRLYRSPLSAADRDLLLQIHGQAGEVMPSVPEFRAGVALMVEAMLQSPLFLYRIEVGTPGDEGLRQLSAWELASRLSYFLWNTAPDDALLQRAADGSLTDPAVLRAQAERLLASSRAASVVESFHRQLLSVDKFGQIGPSPAFFPDVSDRLPEFAREETRRFLAMVFEEGGLDTLLTSNRTFVNAELARIYGLEGDFGDTFVPVDLPGDQRAGFFTHVGWLATNATPVEPDPIHRGVFLSERMACNHIALPPADIPPLPPPNGGTNRQRVESHTEAPGTDCAGCHGALINPFGFPFESFDAVGAFRTEDNGIAVNTRGQPLVGGLEMVVEDAVDMMEQFAASEAIHTCYAEHWLEFAFGRLVGSENRVLAERLGRLSADGTPVQALILELVTSRPFRTRVEEAS